MLKPITEVFPLLEEPKYIVITTHHKPDGDAMGSMLGLYHYLKNMGHHVAPISPSEVPDFLHWMPGMSEVYNFESESTKAKQLILAAELIFCLDFNNFNRVKDMEPFLANCKAMKVLIDHHMFPADVFEYGTSEPEKSSTAEMVYDFIISHKGENHITEPIASCLYTGVMTDTGSFRFPVVTAQVYEMLAVLKHKGLQHHTIHEEVYDTWSEKRMRFIGKMLLDRMVIYPEWKSGFIVVYQKDLQEFQLSSGDTEGLVNYPLSIHGIRFATLITERVDEVRLSFRSKGDFDVNLFARTHFQGGGHFNASGGRSTKNIEETLTFFKEKLSQFHP